MKQYIHRKSHEHSFPVVSRLILALSLLLALTSFAGAAISAAQTATPLAQQATKPPAPVGTSGIPNPVPSGIPPAPVVTGQPAAPNSANSNGNSTGPTSIIGGFPWLIVALVVLALLIIAAVALMMSRRTPSTAPAGPGAPADVTRTRPGNVRPYTSTSTSASTDDTPAATEPVAQAVAPAVALPDTITCSNCGAINDINENFCHECGQDLRPMRAQLVEQASAMPAAIPAAIPAQQVEDVVGEDTPYLETLDRTDEQLEYVLSRPLVVIGTAPDCDIVVDSAFKGWQSVSPHHAELRREQEGFSIVDRASENGTFVNEMRTGENLLSDGDNIRLGEVRFVFHVPSVA